MNETDLQLIELVEHSTPDELTLDQIEALRERLTDSATLRNVLYEQLKMEQYLSHALGRVNISVDAIIAQARRQQRAGAMRFAWLGLCLCAILAGGIWLLTRQDKPKRPIADAADAGQENQPSDASDDRVAQDKTDRSPDNPAIDPANNTDTNTNATHDPQHDPVFSDPKPVEPTAGPWAAHNQLAAPPRAFFDLATSTTEVDAPVTLLNFQKWFAPELGLPHMVATPGDAPVAFSGVWRMNPVWPADAMLRLRMVADNTRFRIHTWNGKNGITFEAVPGTDLGWVAYRTTRTSDAPLPETMSLAASDDGRHHRFDFGGQRTDLPVDLWHADEQLVLSRGSTRLVTVPNEQVPQDVYLEVVGPNGAGVKLSEIKLVRCKDFPIETNVARTAPPPADAQQPAARSWQMHPFSGNPLETHSAQGVRLVCKEHTTASRATTAVASGGIHDLIFKIDRCTDRTAIALGDAEGNPLYMVRFCEHQVPDGQVQVPGTFVQLIQPEQQQTPLTSVDARQQLAVTDGATWLRVRVANGSINTWIGTDGERWAKVGLGTLLTKPGIAIETVSLHCLSDATLTNNERREIAISHFSVRPYSLLNDLAPAELISQVPRELLTTPIAEWKNKVDAARPKDVDAIAWYRACAIHTIGGNAPRALTEPLLDKLLLDAFATASDLDTRVAIIEQYATIFDWRNSPQSQQRWQQLQSLYGVLAHEVLLAGNQPSCRSLMQRAFELPISARQGEDLLSANLARAELMHLISNRRWTEVREFVSQLALYKRQTMQPLTQWSLALSASRLPFDADESFVRPPLEMRHPLVLEQSRQDALFLAVFRDAIAQQSYEEACRVLTLADFSDATSVLPMTDAEDIWSSPTQFVSRTMLSTEPLRRLMQSEYELRGKVRLAYNQREPDAIAKITSASVQLIGTTAAGEAHLWLGDKELQAAHTKPALYHYREAERWLDADRRQVLAARLRLSAAHEGRQLGQPSREAVQLADKLIPPAEFEKRVAEALQKAGTVATPQRKTVHDLAPVGLKLAQRYPWQGVTSLRAANIDHLARHTDLVADDQRLYVCDNRTIAAIELASGKELWRSTLSNSSSVSVRCRIEFDHERIYVCDPGNHNIYAINKANGKPLWHAMAGSANLYSDPILLDGQLFVLGVLSEQFSHALSLNCLDAKTGALVWTRPLARLEQNWTQDPIMSLTRDDDGFVAVLAGAVIAMHDSGHIRWIRRRQWVPSALLPREMSHHRQQPIVDGQRLYVASRCSLTIECIDLATGNSLWTCVAPSACRIVGRAKNDIIANTATDLFAIHADKGTVVWQHAFDEHSQSAVVDAASRIIVTENIPIRSAPQSPPDKFEFQFAWLDAATGKAQQVAKVEGLTRGQPFFGPWISHEGHVIAIAAAEQVTQPDLRDIVRIDPAGSAVPPPAVSKESIWLSVLRKIDAVYFAPYFNTSPFRNVSRTEPSRSIRSESGSGSPSRG